LRQARPGLRIVLTHGTATGREAGRGLLAAGDHQAWLPYDTPGAVRRFHRRHQPAVGVLMETEIWPNLLHLAHEVGLPMVLANARLSDRSLAKGRRLGLLMRPAVAALTRTLAQTEADADRLRQSGVPKVQVSGNLKFDMTPAPALVDRGREWRRLLARPVVLAASTREGEEDMLLQSWAGLPLPRGPCCWWCPGTRSGSMRSSPARSAASAAWSGAAVGATGRRRAARLPMCGSATRSARCRSTTGWRMSPCSAAALHGSVVRT
jgi:3-deoxy-D-manno-octulosonic-acid transferase